MAAMVYFRTPGVSDGQGGLTCCDPWGRKELDTTERLNWTELRHPQSSYQMMYIFKSYSISGTLGIFFIIPWRHHFIKKILLLMVKVSVIPYTYLLSFKHCACISLFIYFPINLKLYVWICHSLTKIKQFHKPYKIKNNAFSLFIH